MSKIIQYGEEAKKSVINGIDAVANIVKTTVGPNGRNVLIKEDGRPPLITNDGVTIAKAVQLKDKSEDAGAQLIISSANKTNEVAGDGTTTTTILAQEMIHKYTELVTDEGKTNPVQVQKEMISCANLISDYLKTKATPIENIDDIKRVATISSGSEEIGNLIGNAFEASGEYGSVIVEDSKTGNDGLRTTQGMKLTNGSINQFLFTDRVNRKTDLLDVNILITKDRLDSATDVLPLLDDCAQTGRKLLILCEDCENDIINTIIMNKVRYGANLNISIVRIPGYGDIKDNIIDDICLATGATKMGREFGISIKEYTPKYLGIVDQIVVGLDETILKFTDTGLNNEDLAEARHNRAIELNEQLQNAQDNEKQAFKKRISNLIDGISVIEVGGNSDVEIQDKKLRIEDAINSVLSAKEEGIVTGGGYSFLDVYMNMTVDNSIGSKIVMDSLKAVTKQIAENAGYNGDAVVKDCLEKKLGFNALTGNYENLIETGVINSVKVDRYSVINATSIAATVITMGGNIVEENEKDPNILQLAGPIPEVL